MDSVTKNCVDRINRYWRARGVEAHARAVPTTFRDSRGLLYVIASAIKDTTWDPRAEAGYLAAVEECRRQTSITRQASFERAQRLEKQKRREQKKEKEMKFPSSSAAGPWVRIDGRSGQFIISTPEGEPDFVDPKDKVIGVDLANARQGWLQIDQGVFDWAPLENEDDWGTPPSEHHKPGVQCNLVSTSGIFGDSPVRSCTAATKAWTTFVGNVHEKCANDLNPDTIPTIKITATRPVKIGKGNSIDIAFDVAPPDKWIKRSDLPSDEAASDSDDSWG